MKYDKEHMVSTNFLTATSVLFNNFICLFFDSFLKRLGLRQHSDIFTQKNVHTVDQLEEINMEVKD